MLSTKILCLVEKYINCMLVIGSTECSVKQHYRFRKLTEPTITLIIIATINKILHYK